MQTFLTILHVLVSTFMILVILLQAGKGGGLSSLAGGAGSAVMGGRSSQSVLGRVTTVCAALFMVTSLTLAYLSTRGESVIMDELQDTPAGVAVEPQPEGTEAPSDATEQPGVDDFDEGVAPPELPEE